VIASFALTLRGLQEGWIVQTEKVVEFAPKCRRAVRPALGTFPLLGSGERRSPSKVVARSSQFESLGTTIVRVDPMRVSGPHGLRDEQPAHTARRLPLPAGQQTAGLGEGFQVCVR
jgi:hypothetical protein